VCVCGCVCIWCRHYSYTLADSGRWCVRQYRMTQNTMHKTHVPGLICTLSHVFTSSCHAVVRVYACVYILSQLPVKLRPWTLYFALNFRSDVPLHKLTRATQLLPSPGHNNNNCYSYGTRVQPAPHPEVYTPSSFAATELFTYRKMHNLQTIKYYVITIQLYIIVFHHFIIHYKTVYLKPRLKVGGRRRCTNLSVGISVGR